MGNVTRSTFCLSSIRCSSFAGFVACLALLLPSAYATADDGTDLFESEVRPLLLKQCIRCHGPKKQEASLRVDSRQALSQGGDSGPAIVRGEPQASLLIKAVRRSGDLEMPPEEKLSDREVKALEHWIKLGAPWPNVPATSADTTADKARQHWAFLPVSKPQVPQVEEKRWSHSPIDAFVGTRLKAAGLQPSPPADRRMLIRRATYALTGLPPSADDVQAFVADPDPQAHQELIDRLLDSPHYGEQWARHWLDVARYSDTKGYVYAREERFWTHAWAYRDWVVKALNADMPYDRFLLLQLAADQVDSRQSGDLAAMGFLTLGRRFLGVANLIIDDRIDVVTRGMMGLTVGCARCHNHKYDPIPTADYYSLYGVFASCSERLVPLDDSAADEAFQKNLNERQAKLANTLAAKRAESSQRARQRVADYLHAQTELEKYPADGFDQVFQTTDLLPAFVRRFEDYLFDAAQRNDPVFTAWRAYAALPRDRFAADAISITKQLQELSSADLNPIVATQFVTPPQSFVEVTRRYGDLLTRTDEDWQTRVEAAKRDGAQVPAGFDDEHQEQLRRVLYGPQAPCQVPDEPIVHIEGFFDSGSCTALWKLQGEVDRSIVRAKGDSPFARTLVDRTKPTTARVFRRGDPIRKGRVVPRQFLSMLAGEDRTPFQQGSGRLELARAIIDPANPLTARVIVNRVWAHHFGQGLVPSTSDFGTRAAFPSHPELLDWLTTRFVEEGWSLKKLHRWIMNSEVYRLSSTGSENRAARELAQRTDPSNRLLWRMRERRLSFEELRDSMLVTTDKLDLRLGGKPSKLFDKPYPTRRTLYGLVDRQFLPGTLRVFDFANPDLHIAQRRETTVPQQALFFLNHPLVLEHARELAKLSDAELDPQERVRSMFRQAFQREPTVSEIAEALELVRYARESRPSKPRVTVADWSYGYGAYDEQSQRVTGFTRLPHFTGTAWQGGPKWPDTKLGWVQLTADGGHPGNDRSHAAVRRWTAPRPMNVKVQSLLDHRSKPGDGIRAFVVSSKSGLLGSTKIHQQDAKLKVDSLEVEQGDTIDFVVDIGDVLNSDEYLWEATIVEVDDADARLTWNSKWDFPVNDVAKLTPWEQLAHVMFCTNEFLFVD